MNIDINHHAAVEQYLAVTYRDLILTQGKKRTQTWGPLTSHFEIS